MELLLVRQGDPVSLQSLPEGVRLVAVPSATPPDEYRALGLKAATGDVVLLTSDVEAARVDWPRVLVHRLGLIGGSGGSVARAVEQIPASHGNPVA